MREFDLGAVTAYALAVKNGFEGTEQEWIASLVPELSIGEVKTLEAGSSAAAAIGGTPQKPVLNLGLPRGKDGHAADWNQNDPAQPDYVQNRTHYEDENGAIVPLSTKYLPGSVPYVEDSNMVEILPECQAASAGSEVEVLAIPNAAKAEIIVGEHYTVKWNGVEYPATAIDGEFVLEGVPVLANDGANLDTGEGVVFLIQLGTELLEDEGFVFGGLCVGMDGSTEVTLSVYQGNITVHKLDNRCLDLAWMPIVKETLLEEIDTAEGSLRTSDKVNQYTMPFGTKLVVYVDGVRCEVTVGGDGSADNGYFFYCYNNAGVIVAIVNLTQAGYMVQAGEGTHTVAFYSPKPNKLPEGFLPDSVESVILRSSTAGSAKWFKLTVDDSGVITATEVSG